MAYERFLVDTDYYALITEEGLVQLIRDRHERIPQAEQAAEMSVREYLEQYYEIEKTLERGKKIREYSELVCYPAGVFFKKDEMIYRTLTAINAIRKPTAVIYWEVVYDISVIQDVGAVMPYLQLRTYKPGDIVKFGTAYWKCLVANGMDFKNVQMPGVVVWEQVPFSEWLAGGEYKKDDVVRSEGVFYQLGETDDSYDPMLDPAENDYWDMIGDYTTDYEYTVGEHDYVVCEGLVFQPVINPNVSKLEENVNIIRDDPRNLNLVKHMSQLALYNLHKLISPTNISETRRYDYEESMDWLVKASKFKLNPQIRRKIDDEDGKPKLNYAFASYQKEFDPYENPWLI